MAEWKNLDTLASYKKLCDAKKTDLKSEISGENGGILEKGKIKSGVG